MLRTQYLLFGYYYGGKKMPPNKPLLTATPAPTNAPSTNTLPSFPSPKSSVPRTSYLNPSLPSFQPSQSNNNYTTQVGTDATSLTDLANSLAAANLAHDRTVAALQQQADKNAKDVADMQAVLRNDFQTVGCGLEAFDAGLNELKAQNAVLFQERHHMMSFLKARALADAEAQELYARRLRESVACFGAEPAKMLELTDGQHLAHADSGDDASVIAIDAASKPETLQSTSAPVKVKKEATVPDHCDDNNKASIDHNRAVAEWLPHALTSLRPLSIKPLTNPTTFTWEFLHLQLGGAQYSPGLYLTSPTPLLRSGKRTYWLLESHFEPYAPRQPGAHGAKLTAFFNDTPPTSGEPLDADDYSDVPLFISLGEGQGYQYLGQYSQPRYSDVLSHSELYERVPLHVREYWAAQLADPQRPEWVTEQLREHFWPKPTYAGPIPRGSAATTPLAEECDGMEKALDVWLKGFCDWEKDSRLKVSLLSEGALMEMWGKSDLDVEKGLRLWWEYLECVGFDEGLYGELVELQQGGGGERAKVSSGGKKVVVSQVKSKEKAKVVNGGQQAASSPPAAPDNLPMTPAGLVRPRRPAAIRVAEYNGADMVAVRELHDSATKAGEKKRQGKILPPHMRGRQ
ncbi:hypothetical protein FACS1894166_08650 [Bacilli bacterium]|nr:hypothetical protein FACS1894166_08540 [Bacilli bacterium]GHU33359.1 hypothetical protein FACS1894166_08650 [Bacilli bacterium]